MGIFSVVDAAQDGQSVDNNGRDHHVLIVDADNIVHLESRTVGNVERL